MALLLLRGASPIAFVKIRHGHSEALANEERAVRAMSVSAPGSFRVPKPLSSGVVAGWHYLAVAPLPVVCHKVPTNPPLQAILEEVRGGLASLPRPHGTPPNWQPMHGDFAPWNLRATADGALYLVDWESAAWGPPDADEVYYRATEAALTGRPAPQLRAPEAIRFWREQFTNHSGGRRDRALTVALAQVLDRLSADGTR
jgi:hypothetical protein